MPEPLSVTIPLLNPNEPEAQLIAVHVSEGQHVTSGDLLCTLETTKSTAEVTAEKEGYIAGLALREGLTVHAGDRLCYLADDPDWKPPAVLVHAENPRQAPVDGSLPEGLRISQPALMLAQRLGVELSVLPIGPFITEGMVRQLSSIREPTSPTRTANNLTAPIMEFDPTAILVYGGGGHGKALIDLLRALKVYRIVGVIDDGLAKEDPSRLMMGLPVLGGVEALPELYARGVRLAVNAVGGIGNIGVRVQVFQRLAGGGFSCPAVAHPSAVVEPSALLAAAVQVFPLAYVGSEARIGFGAIVNTSAVVSHDCIVGDYANISPGALLAGEVQIGEGALIGMGVTINLRAKIGRGARVGNSAVVKADVPENGVVRAGTTWPA